MKAAQDMLSPYRLIKELNARFGISRPTQMGYNYCRKGYIPSSIVAGKIAVTRADAEAWMAKFADANNLIEVA